MNLTKTQKIISKAKVNPVFKGLSDDLKDPKHFKEIEKKLFLIMVSDHKHRDIKSFVKCKRCAIKIGRKSRMIKELGFNSFKQYQNYKKVMQIILNKRSLDLYAKEK